MWDERDHRRVQRPGVGARRAGSARVRLCDAGLKAQARFRTGWFRRQFRAARCMAVWTARLAMT